ncbi:alpha/beta hydrolase [Nocardioides sp. GY 10113]|uniref:alpha/beta fold hydrolase n=1 Tax=Nocardioides sp. GY 10113 TaxID=2569761 RepID=UPI0010A76152|nr:alpha/beta hydrolase [Nocardioides sp. GY 10113]TIC88448.1 alpha/beta hydrolase [Nocardioides sp. GY 10113]
MDTNAMGTRSMDFGRRTLVTEDGLRLQVTVRGRDDAPLTVLLAHCWTADEQDWHYQVHDLMVRYGHDLRVITWDHRGHGRSDAAPEAACTVAHLARDLGGVVDAFAPEGPLLLAGHSIGGMAMTALPQERPDLVARVAGLLFVSTSAGEMSTVTLGLPAATTAATRDRVPAVLATRARRLSRSQRRRTPILERRIMRRFVFGGGARPRDVGVAVDQLIACPPETMSGFYRDMMTHERGAALAAYDGVRTVVLVGSRDLLTPPAHGRRIARSIRGARLLVAPGAGHMLPMERAELVTEHLCELIDRALAEPAGPGSGSGSGGVALAVPDEDDALDDLDVVGGDRDLRVVQAPTRS